ncbi:MAG: ATP-binding cassette domain-containing protein [Desulfobacterales bacterium]
MTPPAEPPLIRLRGVSVFYGDRPALAELDLEVGKNERLWITGPSGAGKTTLLRLLCGAVRAERGEVEVDGVRLDRAGRRDLERLRRRLGIVFQDPRLIAGFTLHENLALGLEASGERPERMAPKIERVLARVGLAGRGAGFPPALSGGEQQRAAVARALVREPRILLADEPTGNLDAESARAVTELLEDAWIRGTTLLIATHDRDLAARPGGRILRLERGRIAAVTP